MSHIYVTLDYQREDHWSDQANCRDKAFEIFCHQEKDSPLCEGMNYQDRMDFNDANFTLAGEICIECPVMFQCLNAASPEEKYWTVRGGEMPGRFKAELVQFARPNNGRPPGAVTKNRKVTISLEPGDRECARGHIVKGGGRCKMCKRASNARRMREARARQKNQVA